MTKTLFSIVLLASSVWAHSGHQESNNLKAHLTFRNKTLHVHTEFTAAPAVGTESFLNLNTRKRFQVSLPETAHHH